MNQKTVLIAGLIGLIFGLLFAGTLGLDFFGTNDMENNQENTENMDDDEKTLKKDAEAFRLAYNLTDSIYMPILGEDANQMIEDGGTFILYIGRDTCPYCQQYVPVLQTAAENVGYTTIYHVDSIDPLNSDFVDDEGVVITPTTYLIKDGVVVETIIDFQTREATEQLITDNLS